MYVITADQIGSSTRADRVADTVAELNAAFAGRLTLLADRNAGDELQLATDDPDTALSIIGALTRSLEWSVGCGIGPVREPLPNSTREASGPAFSAARRAVDRAKRAQHRFALEAELVDGSEAEALIDLLLLVRSRRTDQGWALHDLVAAGRTQSEAAAELGISAQAASQRARAAGTRVELAALPAIAAVLSRVERSATHNGSS